MNILKLFDSILILQFLIFLSFAKRRFICLFLLLLDDLLIYFIIIIFFIIIILVIKNRFLIRKPNINSFSTFILYIKLNLLHLLPHLDIYFNELYFSDEIIIFASLVLRNSLYPSFMKFL